ncbi:unnamed protein product [Cuscuta epithymum]|uniref:Thioredoxin-like fold domain-containing protein n=1 Tax=Cuscuta epithymum TaxID=186058 RepID=A0AAV0EKQ2_9ASTE|nr:unnamed protein product [Cuscuta epithymum]
MMDETKKSGALKRCSGVKKEKETGALKRCSGGEKEKETGALKRCRGGEKEKKKKKKKEEDCTLKRCSGVEKETGALKLGRGGEKEKKKEKKKEKEDWTLKRCSHDPCVCHDLLKRPGRPYSLFDSENYFPSPVNTISPDFTTGEPHDFFEFPEEIFMEECKPLNIKKGEKLPVDVFSLLSNGGKTSSLVRNNGERVGLVDAIAGKYLVVCCFFVPMFVEDPPHRPCRALIATYNDLKKKNLNFEMVMVAKMRSTFISKKQEEPAFDWFFSAFPCLAVPFSDSSTRDSICKLLGIESSRLSSDGDACLVLDPDQKVLQTHTWCFENYGAASFPFTDHHLDSIKKKIEEVRLRLDPVYRQRELGGQFTGPLYKEPVTLEELLCCESSMLLHKCDGSSLENKVISVADLSKSKFVVLYLCFDAEFMSRLEIFRRRCVQRKQQFEVVIINLSYFSDESSYSEAFKLALKENDISSWWELPFVDHVSRRLYQIVNVPYEDDVIIWAGGGRSGELSGLALMEWIGSRNLYPITRKKWLDDKLSALRSLTLESFLSYKGGKRGYSHLTVSDLKNRKILLYFGSSSSLLKKLLDSYKQIKEDYPGSEVVFAPICNPNPVTEMPWPQLSSPVAIPKVLSFEPILVAFGEDNRIKSLHAEERLDYREKEVSLFDDTLRNETFLYLMSEIQR